MNSIQFFIERLVDEETLLNTFSLVSGKRFESLEFSTGDFCYFVQFQEYSSGFRLGVNVVSKDEDKIEMCESEFLRRIVSKIGTRVLYESRDDEWTLVECSGELNLVNVDENEQGISLVA